MKKKRARSEKSSMKQPRVKPRVKSRVKFIPIKLIPWLASFICALLIFFLTEHHDLEVIKPGEPPVLYANVCQDDLEKLFTEAIQGAEQSVFLVIYSLSDQKLIRALNSQAEKGLNVTVMHDVSTHQTGFQKLSTHIENVGIKRSGLMHQKILVVDAHKVWIGSANMTTDSLKVHDNLVVGVIDHDLASAILCEQPFALLNIGGQKVEYWDFPKKGKEGVQRLVDLIDGARKTIKVAMFTWTHPDLTAAVIRAHKRGVKVQIVHDKGQAVGVCIDTITRLSQSGIDIRLSSGLGLLHHKFAWIDNQILVNGSANWTLSAFSRNRDCFLILHTLTTIQNAKLKEVWERTFRLMNKEHLSVFRQGPTGVRDHELKSIRMAA